MVIAAGADLDAADFGGFSSGWITYLPAMYTNMNTTRSTIARTINRAKYLRIGSVCMVKLDITANATTTNGMAVQLPMNALERELACGSGAIFTGTTPTAPNVVSLGPGTPTDAVMMTTYSNAFVDITNGQTFRCTFMYEPA
jgi:hypothetical protein